MGSGISGELYQMDAMKMVLIKLPFLKAKLVFWMGIDCNVDQNSNCQGQTPKVSWVVGWIQIQ